MLYLLLLSAYVVLVIRLKREIRDVVYDTHLFDKYTLLWTPWLKISVHRMLHHDVCPYLHDHPWRWARSLILWGGYLEAYPSAHRFLRRGDWNVINRNTRHRIDHLFPNTWTLFFAGRSDGPWGFWTSAGWVHHDDMGRP